MKTNINILKKLLVLSLAIAAAAPLCAMEDGGGGVARQSLAATGAGGAGARVPSLRELAARAAEKARLLAVEDPQEVPEWMAGAAGEARTWLAENNPKLMAAAEAGEVAQVRKLIAQGANVNTQNDAGWTPLHMAARFCHEAVVTALLVAGANKEFRDRQGRTAADLARENRHEAVVQIIEQHGQGAAAGGAGPAKGAVCAATAALVVAAVAVPVMAVVYYWRLLR